MRDVLLTHDISTIVPSNVSSSILSEYAPLQMEVFSSISICTVVDGTQWNTRSYTFSGERLKNIRSISNYHKIKNKEHTTKLKYIKIA